MVWTEQQRRTIETRGKNVLVSAAAGSGKTAVLTERILRIVTEGRVPLKELLVVTFTEAAASEMKSRIAAALTAAAEEDPFAEAQLRQLGAAKIMTFHAFCLTVLRRYYYVIGLDPSFSVADAKRAEALREEAADEMFAKAFADEDEAFRDSFTEFLLCYSDARDERKARDKIFKAYEFIMTLPDPFGWLSENVGALSGGEDDFDSIPAVRFMNGEVANRLAFARTLTEGIGALLSSLGLFALGAKNAVDLETVSRVERLFLAGDREGTGRALADISFERFVAANAEKETYQGVKDLVTLRRDRVKEILRKEIGEVFFAQHEGGYAGEIAHVGAYARTLETLIGRFADTYTRIKRGENIIDFADFEHMALEILGDEGIADDYRRRLSYIFVDEYQDSNYVQEALVSRITRGDNVFMVGDVKQSIYSFRNAAPAIFLEKQGRFPAEDIPGVPDLRIGLSRNFRSKAGVIGAVNAVFGAVMERRYSGMEYDDDARLVKGIDYGGEWEGKTCLHLIKKDSGKELFDSDTAGEAALCADIIKDTVGREFFDAKRGVVREIRYGDIAILLRAARKAADVYRDTLEACGIPAVTDRGEGYFETVEIDTFLALLRAIVNLRRDVPLAASMCSAVFGFGLSELAEIRLAGRDGFFYSAFLAYAENGADAGLGRKCAEAAARLAKWRDEERFMRLDDFLWKLMRESGFYDYAGSLPRGALRQANLRALLDRAANFQSGRVEGLRGFLGFLGRIRDRGGVAQATVVTDGEDVCRIMTVHRSKGLEFPVVLLAGLGKPFAAGGYNDEGLLLHRDAGLSLYWVDHAAHTYKNTFLHSALSLRREIDERAEDIRLLYVGMTRAMDTLHLIGTMGDPEKWAGLYGADEAEAALETDIFGASNYLHLLMPTAMKRRDVFGVQIYEPKTAPDIQTEGETEGDGSCVPETKGDGSCVQAPGDGGASGFDAARTPEEPYSFVYPYAASAKLKSKYSVTELGRLQSGEESGAQKDAGLEAEAGAQVDTYSETETGAQMDTGSETETGVLISDGAQGDGSHVQALDSGDITPQKTGEKAFFIAGSKGEAEEDAGLSAAEKGTALHKALQLLDFGEAQARSGEEAWFEEYLSGLQSSGALSALEAGSVSAKTLMRFARSRLAARAAASGFLMKEAPFNMKLPYSEAVFVTAGDTITDGATPEYKAESGSDEEIVVQGVIDCLFEEEGELVVVDYKSGWFDIRDYEAEAERIRAAYGTQLRLYRRAAGLIFDKPVKECLVYMARVGVTVEIE